MCAGIESLLTGQWNEPDQHHLARANLAFWIAFHYRNVLLP
jgi:hypothetical protein